MNNLSANYLAGLIKKVLPYLKILILLLLITANLKSLAQQFPEDNSQNDADFFQKWDERFEPVKKELPFDNGIIGYATDFDILGIEYDTVNTVEHILTQFTLAPIIVSKNTNLDWILLKMDSDNIDTWLKMQVGEFEVMSYKHKLHLVHKTK